MEADEAFHVYDHPAVFIFRKSPDYSRAKVEAALAGISLKQAHELQDSEGEAQLLGVFYWSSVEADTVPTALTYPPEDYEAQTSGGTWSERFFSDSIINRNQVVGALAWYATIFIFGALAFPLIFALFPTLADGGYAVCKLAGMLLVAWFCWAVSSLKIPIWSQAGNSVFAGAAGGAERFLRLPPSFSLHVLLARSLAAARLDRADRHRRFHCDDPGALDQS